MRRMMSYLHHSCNRRMGISRPGHKLLIGGGTFERIKLMSQLLTFPRSTANPMTAKRNSVFLSQVSRSESSGESWSLFFMYMGHRKELLEVICTSFLLKLPFDAETGEEEVIMLCGFDLVSVKLIDLDTRGGKWSSGAARTVSILPETTCVRRLLELELVADAETSMTRFGRIEVRKSDGQEGASLNWRDD